jgi:hypothetical protein
LEAGARVADSPVALKECGPGVREERAEEMRDGERLEGEVRLTAAVMSSVATGDEERLSGPAQDAPGGGKVDVGTQGHYSWADDVEMEGGMATDRCAGFMGGGPVCGTEKGVVDGTVGSKASHRPPLDVPRAGSLAAGKGGGEERDIPRAETEATALEPMEEGEFRLPKPPSEGEMAGGVRHSRSVSPVQSKKLKTGKGPTKAGVGTRSQTRTN